MAGVGQMPAQPASLCMLPCQAVLFMKGNAGASEVEDVSASGALSRNFKSAMIQAQRAWDCRPAMSKQERGGGGTCGMELIPQGVEDEGEGAEEDDEGDDAYVEQGFVGQHVGQL